MLKAGQRAQQVYANRAAIDYYELVLPLLTDAEKPTVLLDLGKVQELVGRWQEAKATYEQALALAQVSGDRRIQAWSEIAHRDTCYASKVSMQTQQPGWLKPRRALSRSTIYQASPRCYTTRASLAAHQGDFELAQRLFEESLTMRQELGDKANIANLYNNLGIVARHRDDATTARGLYEDSLAIRQELGDRWGIGIALNNLGNLALVQGDLTEARVAAREGTGDMARDWRSMGHCQHS